MDAAQGRSTIFITGAASGIGKASAELFASRGWYVGLYDVDETGLAQVAESIGPDNCCQRAFDVRDRSEWDRAVAHFADHTGGTMDFLFNNAGVLRHGWFDDVTHDDADLVIDVNVKGVVNGVYAALPVLKATAEKKGVARIFNTASAAGLYGIPRQAIYSASKFFVRGFTESLNAEMSRYNIEVSDLMPGIIDTPMADQIEEKSNTTFREGFTVQINSEVNPVAMVAEEVWAAAGETKLHRPVGAGVARHRFIANHLPGLLKKRLTKFVEAHSRGDFGE